MCCQISDQMNTFSRRLFISRSGETYGPYSLTEAREYWMQGNLSGDDFVFFEGDKNMRPLREIVTLSKEEVAKPIALARKQGLQQMEEEYAALLHHLKPRAYVCPNCRNGTVQNARVLYEGGTTISHTVGNTVGIAGFPGDGDTPMMGMARTHSAEISRNRLAELYAPPASPRLISTPVNRWMFLIMAVLLAWLVYTCIKFNSWSEAKDELEYCRSKKNDTNGLAAENPSRFWAGFYVISVCAGSLVIYFAYLGFIRYKKDSQVASWENVKRRHDYRKKMAIWENSYLCHTCGYFGTLNIQ